jgi:WD40 repeat protein
MNLILLFSGDVVISGGTDQKVFIWDLETCSSLFSVSTESLCGASDHSEKSFVRILEF